MIKINPIDYPMLGILILGFIGIIIAYFIILKHTLNKELKQLGPDYDLFMELFRSKYPKPHIVFFGIFKIIDGIRMFNYLFNFKIYLKIKDSVNTKDLKEV